MTRKQRKDKGTKRFIAEPKQFVNMALAPDDPKESLVLAALQLEEGSQREAMMSLISKLSDDFDHEYFEQIKATMHRKTEESDGK